MGYSMRAWFAFLVLQPPLVDQGCQAHTLGSKKERRGVLPRPRAWQSAWFWKAGTTVAGRAARRKSGGVKFEEGMFDDTLSPENMKRGAEHGEGIAEERGNDGLIPQQWITLRDNLHKTKSEKKLELRLQAIETSMQRAAELQLKRQKLENASMLLKDNAVCGVDFIPPVEEHNVVSPETPASLKVKKDTKSSQAHHTSNIFFFDSELHHWFNEDEIAHLKRSEPDLTKIYCEKWPPLQVLVASGQFFFLDEFLKSHVDLNSVDEDGYTPIHRAVLGRKETAVSQLLRAGADVNVLDRDGASFLHYSVQAGSLKMVRLFVKCGVDLNHSDKNGWGALHVAALTGREDIVRHLLVSGADKHQKTKEGHAPLDLCLASGKGHRAFAVAKILKRLPRENIRTAADLELNKCLVAGE